MHSFLRRSAIACYVEVGSEAMDVHSGTSGKHRQVMSTAISRLPLGTINCDGMSI